MSTDWVFWFLLNRIWVRFNNFVLNFIAAFRSDSGLQIIVFHPWSFV